MLGLGLGAFRKIAQVAYNQTSLKASSSTSKFSVWNAAPYLTILNTSIPHFRSPSKAHLLEAMTNVFAEVERKFCLMLVDKMQLRLSRMSDTVTRHERSLMVC